MGHPFTAPEPDPVGRLVLVRGELLCIVVGTKFHPIKVTKDDEYIEVGCTTVTRAAWEFLKKKIDGT
jgi:hypothetical protein